MSQPRYSIKHQDHQKYICRGLSGLQQNGDFVDMTIAADGHFVKVHKIVMSLASPYFKQLISETEGNPVVYLNKVSFQTLCSILEYIYMGESRIEADKLEEFTQVSKDLHINGLDDLIPQSDLRKPFNQATNNFESKDKNEKVKEMAKPMPLFTQGLQGEPPDEGEPFDDDDDVNFEMEKTTPIVDDNEKQTDTNTKEAEALQDKAKVQFTISNQGTLQAIFNRYIYNQCYVYKRNKTWRQWRCFQYRNPCKCPAIMITDHDKIIKRAHVHNHPFHDNSILKKLKKNSIFSAISEAETHVTNVPKKCRPSVE